VFLAVGFTGALHFGVLFAYLSASSFVLQSGYRLRVEEFGLVFAGRSRLWSHLM
jgi:hypothetical protein